MQKIEGREIVLLMHRHKVTIRELSSRMQITQKRIRQIRELGLQEPYAIRDWIQAISGVDPGILPVHDARSPAAGNSARPS